jgi:hypothetical protein
MLRFKEVHGHYPGLKSWSERRALKKQEKQQLKERQGSHPDDSAGSSQLFDGKTSTEKSIEAVREVPTKSISE